MKSWSEDPLSPYAYTTLSPEPVQEEAEQLREHCELLAKVSAPVIISSNNSFSGLPGESPEEYLEEVEIHRLQIAPDKEPLSTRQMNVAFRLRLRGSARLNWDLKLYADKRK